MYFWTGDQHFNHTNIIKYCKRPFDSIEEMNTILIKNFNSKVTKADHTIHVGDLTFKHPEKYIRQLNGSHTFIRGNHDRWLKKNYRDMWVKTIEGQIIVAAHYAYRVWPASHYGSWMLYGHCFDLNTELLTTNGWKKRNEISTNDGVLTVNLETGYGEYNKIQNIVDYPDYSGKVYSVNSQSVNFRVTSRHTMVDLTRDTLKFRKFPAEDTNNINRRLFIHACQIPNQTKVVNLSDDMLRLSIWITTDGSLYNTDLICIRVLKERKIASIRNLLNKIGVVFRELPQKDKSLSFNFTLPSELHGYSLKPLDKIITLLTRHQVKIMLETYSITDGQKIENSYIIYTSKPVEVDIIQETCIKNGFRCGVTSRIHGYSKILAYQLNIVDRAAKELTDIKQRINIETVNKEHFWCVTVPNGTLITRRCGKVLLTGNSHGKLPPIGLQHDVGVDNNDYYPVSFEELKIIFKKRAEEIRILREGIPDYTEVIRK